jgi:hypothetical protein
MSDQPAPTEAPYAGIMLLIGAVINLIIVGALNWCVSRARRWPVTPPAA